MLVAILTMAAFGLDSKSRSVIEAAPPVGDNIFIEDFTWQGNHAASILNNTSSTVWWQENDWDARSDTSYNAASGHGGGDHTDIHRAYDDLEDGRRRNDKFAVGGDGGTGVGVMHLDFEAISSSRLRNPMIISDDQPGVVEFRTTNFVTTGHWWEIAITPTNIVSGGEYTAVPSNGDFFGPANGSGHRPAEDSINYIALGSSDVPCLTGWFLRNGMTRSVGYSTIDVLGPDIPTDPSDADLLFAWRLEYYPDKIVTFVDLNRDGVKEHHNTINVDIPWSEVYVSLLGVAYQADHHPQNGPCGAYQGIMREIPWKDVKVSPVKYARTASYPKNNGTDKIPQDTGWTFYDLRDLQRFGPRSADPPQPNENPYDRHRHNAFCRGGGFECGNSVDSKTLFFDLPAHDAEGIARSQFIYDIKLTGGGSLSVNGTPVGNLPIKSTVPASLESDIQWAQRSVDVDPSLFVAGQNSITVDMVGNVAFDRVHFEFDYFQDDDTPPTAPANLEASAVSQSEIVLNWTASDDPESGIRRYDIYRNGSYIDNTLSTSYSDKNLVENTTYSYHIVALNPAGLESNPSNTDSATTFMDQTPPTVFSAGAASETVVVVRFSESVEQASATNVANYDISSGINVLSASLDSDLKTVILTTTAQAEGSHTITVRNVRDRASSPNTMVEAQIPYAFVSEVIISSVNAASGFDYQVGDALDVGETVYIDRTFTYSGVPDSLIGKKFIKTANGDKTRTDASFLTFNIDNSAEVLVIYDDRLFPPTWLSSFEDTGEDVQVGSGVYNVYSKIFGEGTVVLGGNEGSSESSMYTVVVGPSFSIPDSNTLPTASFSANPNSGNAPLTVSFDARESEDPDGNIVNYAWDFGDGSTGSGSLVNHTFNNGGSYRVELTVTDDDGGSDTSHASIIVTEPNDAPEASFVATPDSGNMPLTVSFDASASSDSDGSIVSYAWDFGDGSTGSGALTSHEFVNPGSYNVVLTVTDDDGESDSAQDTIVVVDPNAPIEVEITNVSAASGANYQVGDAIGAGQTTYVDRSFTYSSVPASIDGEKYIITGNNDKTRTDADFLSFVVNHDVQVFVIYDDRLSTPAWMNGFVDTGDDVFVGSGLYNVFAMSFDAGQVTLGGNHGVSSSSMYAVAVKPVPQAPNDPPQAGFTYNPTSGTAPLTVNFDASGSSDPDGSVVDWSWDFGDGSTGSGEVVSHLFADAGSYSVELTVTDDDGDSDTMQATVTVDEPILLSVGSAEVNATESVAVPVVLSEAPNGLAGYIITATLDSSDARFVGVTFPNFMVTNFDLLSSSQVEFRASDIDGLVADGDSDVLLASLIVEGVAEGAAGIDLAVTMLHDRPGDTIEIDEMVSGLVTVHPAPLPTLPGMAGVVQDLDGDGLYEDANGNGVLDFADLTALYMNLGSAEVQDNAALFDFSGDGLVNDDDVIILLDMIIAAQ